MCGSVNATRIELHANRGIDQGSEEAAIVVDELATVLPTVESVDEAAVRIGDWLIATPILEHDELNARAGARVLVKAESLQHTGSFKIRGALNRLLRVTHDERAFGVVAYSSGNHAQGVAMAAQWLGVDATIVMPEDAPEIKKTNTRALGAEIVLYDRYSEDREQIAADIVERRGAVLVPAFDHPDVIAGQGTVGLETARFAARRRLALDGFFAPCGGGGLIGGSALAINRAFPHCDIVAVEPKSYDDTGRSLAASSRQSVEGHPATLCDALMAPTPGALTFALNRELLARAVTVTDAQALHAMAFAARYLKTVLEPSGAVALAAVLDGAAASMSCVGLVLSGGNVDRAVLERALAEYPEP